MLTKDTLQHIEAQALIAAAKPIGDIDGTHVVVLPESATVVKLEQYQLQRDRFRGHLKTHALADFAKYVEQHKACDIKSRGFVDQDAMSATIIFNLGEYGDAGHGDDTATLTLKPTAAYTALQGIVGKSLSQQTLAEWLEDWAQHIQAKDCDTDLTLVAAINAVRHMTIKATSQRDSKVGDFSGSRSSMDEIEAKSMETLPTAFVFTTVPFEALQPASITLRMSVLTGGETPVLKLRWVGEESQREEFAREFKATLEKEVGGFVPLTIGTFAIGK